MRFKPLNQFIDDDDLVFAASIAVVLIAFLLGLWAGAHFGLAAGYREACIDYGIKIVG